MKRCLDIVAHDVHHAVRTLRKNPVFTVTVLLTLALGIGANTAVFSLIDAIILRPLPVEKPQELALLSPAGSRLPGSSVENYSLSYPMYRELRDRAKVFDGLLCRFRFVANATAGGQTERIVGEMVSGNYFETLGVKAALGRVITADDDGQPGANPVAVLGYDYWMTRFGGDRDVLGRTIHVNGQPLTVIGVSAAGFDGVEMDFKPAVRAPVTMAGRLIPHMSWLGLDNRMSRWVQVIGRLRPGISLSQAQASLQPLYRTLVAGLDGAPPQDRLGEFSLDALPAATGICSLRQDWTSPLVALMAMVALVLALTCLNVANLHIARGLQREGELAVRMALGAGRRRVTAQLFIESVLLAILGGAAGVGLALSVTPLLAPFMRSSEGPANVIVSLDWRILGFCLLVTAAAALAFGLAPSLASTRLDLAPALRRASPSGTRSGRIRQIMVGAQVSLSLVLLVGSLLFVRSLSHLYAIDPGFQADRVVAFGIDPTLNGYPRARVEETYRRLQETLPTLPGVRSVGLGLIRVLNGDHWTTGLSTEQYRPGPGESAEVFLNAISPDYFQTLGIPLLQGREFLQNDRADSVSVIIVNRTFARRYFGSDSVVGRHIRMPSPIETKDLRIVGVVGDAKYDTVKTAAPPQVFMPYSQLFTVMGMTCYVRGGIPANQLVASIRGAIRKIDPTLPIYGVRSMEEQRDSSLSVETCVASVSTAFAALASLLAAVGLYGLLSYTVTRRTREIGLRMALGANRNSVIGLVLKEACLLLGLGVLIGILAALGLGRLIANLLHGVSPHDPLMIAAATLLLTVITVVAAAFPARRALRVNPMEALKYD
jgi:predicted permease